MNILPYSSFEVNRNISQAIEKFFNENLTKFVGTDTLATNVLANVLETDKDYQIELAVPGFTKEQLETEVKDGFVSIRAEVTKDDLEEIQYLRREFSRSNFVRTYQIPEDVNADSITATYDKGVLTLVLPKEEITLISRKIDIE